MLLLQHPGHVENPCIPINMCHDRYAFRCSQNAAIEHTKLLLQLSEFDQCINSAADENAAGAVWFYINVVLKINKHGVSTPIVY